MSKLIDGKFTFGIPFTVGNQYITNDLITEHDTGTKLSSVIDTLQTGNDNFTSNVAVNLIDNSASAMSWNSTGKSNILQIDTTDSIEKVKVNGELNISNPISGASILKLQTYKTTWNFENNNIIPGTFDQLRPSTDNTPLMIATSDNLNNFMTMLIHNTSPSIEILNMPNASVRIGSNPGVLELYGTAPKIGSTNDSTNFDDTGCFNCGGGLSVYKTLHAKYIVADDTVNSSSQTTGALRVKGGIGQASGRDIYCGNDIYIPNNRFLRLGDATNPCTIYNKLGVGLALQYNSIDVMTIYSSGCSFYPNVYNFGTGNSSGNVTFRVGSTLKTMMLYDLANNNTQIFANNNIKLLISDTANTFQPGNATFFNKDTDATSSTDSLASVKILGGLALAKKLYVGTGIHLPTAGGTSSLLNYYEEWSGSATFQTNGSGGTTAVVTIEIIRVGRVCTIYIPTVLIDSNGWTIRTSSAIIPTRLLPKHGDPYFPCKVMNQGVSQTATGLVEIWNAYIYICLNLNAGAFGVGANSGLSSGFTTSYICA